jgi:4-hydroxy-tetrahydrodipicolinate synthase
MMPTTLRRREGTVQGIKDSQNDLTWFRQLVQGIRLRPRVEVPHVRHGMLIDAGAVIGAHGAIPGTGNVAPAAAAEAWEAAARGDWQLAERAIEVVGRYEELVDIARGGSPVAASFASMKTVLQEWGIIESRRLMRPLRSFDDAEAEQVRQRLTTMPHGAERVAQAVA